MRTLYWVRSDMRLHDNESLQHFVDSSTESLIVWFESASFKRAGPHRRAYVLNSVTDFKKSLRSVGLDLVLCHQPVQSALAPLIEKYKFDQIVFGRPVGFEESQDQHDVEALATQRRIKTRVFEDNFLVRPQTLNFTPADMPLVFTDFRKKVEPAMQVGEAHDLKLMSVPRILSASEETAMAEGYKTPQHPAGEKAALQRVQHYFGQTQAVLNYKSTRNGMLNYDDSTKFSPYLSVGSLSARRLFHEVRKFELEVKANDSTYWVIFELLWRDYFKYLALKTGPRLFKQGGIKNHPQNLNKDLDLFEAWTSGQTKSDFVNANMRELLQTGWMSNRGRQNVASYLIHDLNLPWVWGAQYFEALLIDYDVTSNWGNWLYLSGQGTDPRSRRFNTEKQAHDYDPAGDYRKKWLL